MSKHYYSNILLYAFSAAALLFGIRKLRVRKWGKCRNTVRLDNKVVIITGANSGLGYVVAKQLTARNAQVILACRTLESAQETFEKLLSEIGTKYASNLIPMELDLASLKSVQQFATKIAESHPHIHILINNAGVAYPKKAIRFTQDGYEMHMGVNHLGHFYLTHLLAPILQKTHDARVVVVSSTRHEKGNISKVDPSNLLTTGDLYANSKLANAYFARELARKMPQVHVYSLCPGWVYTNLFRHSLKWWHFVLISPIAFLYMRTPEQGAQTILYCATEPKLNEETGLMYRDCKRFTSKMTFEEGIGANLWKISRDIVSSV